MTKWFRSALFTFAMLGFLLEGASGLEELKPLQKALGKYDPIVPKNILLTGNLHFPEIEKILPDFYRQLFEKVSLQIEVSRKSFDLEVKGESEALKEIARAQFMRVKTELKNSFKVIVENDPIYRLGRVRERPEDYKFSAIKRSASTQYRFSMRERVSKKEASPSEVSFYISEEGALEKMIVADENKTTIFRFQSEEVLGKYYFWELKVEQHDHGVIKSRKVEIFYQEKDGVRYPNRLFFYEVDGLGRLIKRSGGLNPVSIEFNSIEVSKKAP